MDNKPNSNAYLKTRVLTASPEQLQLMLYDGAIRFCEQARVAIEAKDIEKSYKLITRAEDIVMELTNGLKDEIDPETCSNMRSLYIFCYEKLIDANLKRELPYLDDAIKVLRHLRETWVMLMEKLQQERSGTETAQQAVGTATDAGSSFGTSGYAKNNGSVAMSRGQQDVSLVSVGANVNFEG